MKRSIVYGFILIVFISGINAQESLQPFPLPAVRLLESPFYRAQNTDMDYILEMDVDRLLAPYLIDAGLEPKAKRYGNWENTGLDGHIGGHYLSALSLMYASTGDDRMLQRINYMLDELQKCQEANGNGYLGGIPNGKQAWAEIAEGKIDAGNFSLNGRWVPLYNIHKIYAGLRDAYWYTGNDLAKDMLVSLTDWMTETTKDLTDVQIQEMLRSEHGGLNEVFADVAEITGNKKYLDMARRFSHQKILQPLLDERDELTGLHANTQIPKVIGYKRIADLAFEDSWSEAADFFWETVTENRSVAIGGNSVREHFNPVDDFSSMIASNQGPETCNTYNMLRLTKLLFLGDPKADYMDYYERALYNHILSTQHPDGGFVYFTPMRPQHYRVYSQPHESFWCCVGSGLENHAKYGEMIYAHKGKDIYVNLFIPSELNWVNQDLKLTQETNFPYEEVTKLTMELEKREQFGLFIRKPSWVKKSGFKITVNGKDHEFSLTNGYAQVSRKWRDGDVVSVALPMQTRVEYLPDNSPWVSFMHGPVVLGAVTDSSDLGGMWSDDSRMGHVASDRFYPLDEAPMIVAASDEEVLNGIEKERSPLTFNVSEIVYPDTYKNLKLVPFFDIHEARYVIYWSLVDPDELDEKLAALKVKEKRMLEMEAITVDQVATGEQQPETEHGFKGEKTQSGAHEGSYWRAASGWFSYELDNSEREGRELQITYFGGDRDRYFDIFLNEEKIAIVEMNEPQGDDFYTVNYKVPESLQKEEALTIRFAAKEDSYTAGVYYIRLIKE